MVTHAKLILVAWLLLALVGKAMAPSWNSVALDGDFDYLPDTRTSVAGGRLLDEAFQGTRSRSQMVIVLGREDGQWSKTDRLLGLDVLRRVYHRLGEVCWLRSEQIACGEAETVEVLLPQPDETPHAVPNDPIDSATQQALDLIANQSHGSSTPEQRRSAQRWLGVAVEALDQAIEIDAEFYKLLGDRVPDRTPTAYEPRLAIAYWDRGHLAQAQCGNPDLIQQDLEAARVLDPDIEQTAAEITQRDLDPWRALLDVYSWKDSVIGSQLRRPHVRIAIMTLASELAATGNIKLLEELQGIVDRCVAYQSEYLNDDELASAQETEVRITGSAAIGGETLLAARSAITYTEWFTVGMILIILAFVYRAPLLVAVPLISIAVAVMVATAMVTMLTQASMSGGWLTLDLKVYTTSRIFVVVILFGAGTDYCLFLISRLREEAAVHPWPVACERALHNVSGALLGSALTTIVGLGMLWFADFGKFHHTGPIIAICLSVGLMVCMTMTPSILRLLGPRVFWPTKIAVKDEDSKDNDSASGRLLSGNRMWNAVAMALTRYPVWTLAAGWVLLILPATGGVLHEQNVTYDLSGQLDQTANSRQGIQILDRTYGVGELAPISVLALAGTDQSETVMTQTRDRLIRELYRIDGVRRVRSMSDPLGDFPPDREMGLLSKEAWRRRALQNHRLARMHFIANEPQFTNRLIRLDVIVQEDPFSEAAAAKLSFIESQTRGLLDAIEKEHGTIWDSYFTGTTASIVDLREVTLRDTRRIKIAVILAVLIVLIIVIRRFALSLYLIATVLLSYYATLGLTYWFFRAIDGPEFLGLDWKLPLFLFVILVAVGQDYNVYLVTRIMEERRRLSPLAAVRRAVARTGGIVTACGIVMAATFLSMTSSAWWPDVVAFVTGSSGSGSANQQTTLRGITELGFALALGVMIDTLYVRTVLVPSFVVLQDRVRRRFGGRRHQG